jgi:hypothetical protein
VLLGGIALAQAPVTQTIHLHPDRSPDPERLQVKKGDRTWYIEWKLDGGQDGAVLFGSYSPCIEGPVIAVRQQHGLCTLKESVCGPDNASTGHRCVFRYRTDGGTAAIVIEEGYTPPPPARPPPANPTPERHIPGEKVRITTRKLDLTIPFEIAVGSQQASIAQTLSAHEAEITIPRVADGKAPVVVTQGGKSERVGTFTIFTAVSRRLTLTVKGETVTLVRSEPYPLAAPPCKPPRREEGPILYTVLAAGMRVGCGVLKDPEYPEVISTGGPHSDRGTDSEKAFTITVPWHLDETIEFSAGDQGALSTLFGFEADKTPRFNSIKVTH